jgi:hypothetical protein
MSTKFSDILRTVGNTPIIRIHRLARRGVNLYVKVDAFNPLSSVKERLDRRALSRHAGLRRYPGRCERAGIGHLAFDSERAIEALKRACP